MTCRDRNQSLFGHQLVLLRQRAHLTQEQLGSKAGLSQGIVASLEQGQREDPRLSTVRKLAVALGVAVTDLMPIG